MMLFFLPKIILCGRFAGGPGGLGADRLGRYRWSLQHTDNHVPLVRLEDLLIFAHITNLNLKTHIKVLFTKNTYVYLLIFVCLLITSGCTILMSKKRRNIDFIQT